MGEYLSNNPLITLFLVIAIGYGLGMVKFGKNKLGVAAVLFCGLIFGQTVTDVHIPDTIIWLGLIIFIYSIGLVSGASFFTSIQNKGWRNILFIFLTLALTAIIAICLAILFDLDHVILAGLYAGSTTNTSSLAALLDLVSQTNPSDTEALLDQAVTGFSIAYPMGIFGVMIAIYLIEKLVKVDYAAEEIALSEEFGLHGAIRTVKVEINNPSAIGKSIRDFKLRYQLNLVFGRYSRKGDIQLPNYDTTFQEGDVFIVLGSEDALEEGIPNLGIVTNVSLPLEGSSYMNKRVFVSNEKIVGVSLASLNLPERFSILISRIRRGDIELMATPNTILELGDRIRFVVRKDQVEDVQRLFGDSYDLVSKINLSTFGIGICLGLIIGTINIPLPGDIVIKLGFAGGPLLMALILGALHKTGPILWTIPYSTNVTLRQIGLILMLAGIGINSGDVFFSTIGSVEGLKIFLVGTLVVLISAAVMLVVGYKLFKIPFSLLLGMVANQPAILDFALEKTHNKIPNIGFALMLPIAIITKIIFTQLIYLFF